MLIRVITLLVTLALIFGAVNHRLHQVVASILPSLRFSIEILLMLCVMMGIWLGLMRIVEALGWMHYLTNWLKPILRRLFARIPKDDPALDYISLNIAANMLGMANAATPFGLHAMRELQRLNEKSTVASDEMCLFLAINTSSVQLLPISAISILAVGGADHPFAIIIPVLLATSVSTVVGILSAKGFARLNIFKVQP